METPTPSVSAENTSQKKYIGSDKISEILNDSDSDGGNFTELSDSDTCIADSPFSSSSSSSSSEVEEIVQPEPDRGRKRSRRAVPKRVDTDFDLGWKEKIQMVQKPAFSGVPGINKNITITQDSSPWDIFEIFFTPEMFKLMQKETNRYATQQIDKKKQEGLLTPKSVFAQWHTVSSQEIKKFFAIIIHMSLLRKSSLRDYWSLRPIIHTPYASSVGMSRDRFLALLTMFHLNNNDAKTARGQPGYDPLFKIRPVIDTLITKFQDTYTPEEQMTIDEAICPFRGRIFFRVYIKGKPHKYGIKIFELCEAKSGYVYNLEVYTGAHPTNSEHNTAFSVVDRLCDKIKGNGHCVYMDRWFSSPKIFDHLWGCKTKAVGTVMFNRKEMPKQAFSVKLKKGEKISRQRDHLLAIKWKDVRDVLLLTTAHEDELVEAPSSRGAHSKIKPAVVLDYNKNKTGVDRSDQMLSYYTFSRKTVKWWKKLFFHLLDLAVVNAHILYKKSSKEKMSLEIFYEKVAEGLLASAGTEIQAVGQTSSPAGRLVGTGHFLYRIPATHGKAEGKVQRSCRVCAEKGKRQTGKTVKKFTTTYCRKCDVGLCIGQCFEVYHSKLKYWE